MFSVCQLRAALPNICDSFSHPPSSLLSFPGPPVCFATRGELLWWELKVSILFLTASVCKSQSLIFWTPGWIWFHFYFVSHLIFTLFQQKKKLPIKLTFLCQFNNFKAANLTQISLKSHHNLWCGMKNIIKWLKDKDIVSLFIQIQMWHIKETPYKTFKEFSQFIFTRYSNTRVHHSVNRQTLEY